VKAPLRAGTWRCCSGRGSTTVHGRAVQVDPIKPKLKAPANKRFKLKYDELVSSFFAFKFNLRRYTVGRVGVLPSREVGRCRLIPRMTPG